MHEIIYRIDESPKLEPIGYLPTDNEAREIERTRKKAEMWKKICENLKGKI